MRADVPWWIAPAVIAISFLSMFALETLWPLRVEVESKLRRTGRNLTLAGISLAIVTLLQAPILVPVARWVDQREIGLLNLVELPVAVETILIIIFLDYTLWIWHWANHKIPLLWRFHLVHHVDRDLDASTAFRFHFGELTLSIFYRALQIVVIGATPLSVWLWQTILFVSILFHHSNFRLPTGVERWVVLFVVTPRMHGIHHSDVREETNSNWSSLLTIWDVLHRTLRLDKAQDGITIGVPAYEGPDDVTIGRILALPFVRQRADWERGESARR